MEQLHLLFPTPVYHNNIGLDYEDGVVVDCERLNSGYISREQNYLLTNLPLKEAIEKEVYKYLRNHLNISPFVDIKHQCSWVLIHKKGDYSPQHHHSNSWLSGVYYISVNENSGKLGFHDSYPYGFTAGNIDPPIDEFTVTNSYMWEFLPRGGDIFIFPSHLTHSSQPNLSEEQRVCVSFNYTLQGEWGTTTNLIKQ